MSVSALGAAPHEGRLGRLSVVLGLVFLLLAGGLGLSFVLPAPLQGDRLVLGLPLGSAVLVYGVGLLPLLVVPLVYAWTFQELGFRPGELEAVRDRARGAAAARSARPAPGNSGPSGPHASRGEAN